MRSTNKQWTAILSISNVFTRQEAEVNKTACILICLKSTVEKHAVKLIWSHLNTKGCSEFSEETSPCIYIRGTVVYMNHRHVSSVWSSYNINIAMYSLQRTLQNIHGESRGPYRNVTSTFSDAVGTNHTSTSITLWRSHHCPSLESAGRIKKLCTFSSK